MEIIMNTTTRTCMYIRFKDWDLNHFQCSTQLYNLNIRIKDTYAFILGMATSIIYELRFRIPIIFNTFIEKIKHLFKPTLIYKPWFQGT